MNYRDERDALRGRIEGLEQDLHDAKREQQDDATKRERIAQIEARMRDTEANLHAMRRELEALGASSKPKNNNKTPLFAAMGVLFLAGAGAAFFLVQSPAPPPPPTRSIEQQPPDPAVVQAPVPATPPETPAQPAPTPARQIKAQWIGQITKVTGLAAAPGTKCTIDATLESTGDNQSVAELSVKCGDKVVYNSADKLEGMSMLSAGMAEEPGKDAGTFAYVLKYSDKGERSGPRTQVAIDTGHRQGFAWSDNIPAFRVDFSVSPLSALVKGEALLPKNQPNKNERSFE
jgi:hypothetical protein